MKHVINLLSTLLVLGLPISAQAFCDRYPNATLTLNLAATIIVPNSLPVGGVIARQAFSGTSPSFFANCTGFTQRTITGRYRSIASTYPTEVPGIGIRIFITDASGRTNAYGLHSQSTYFPPGLTPSFTGAEALLYKTGPVTNGVIPSGAIWTDRWHNSPNNFQLRLGSSVNIVSPVATCDLAAGDGNRTILLDPIRVSAFQGAAFAGARDFELTANCSDAASVTFGFSGTPAPGNSLLFANTGTAGGVALWLYSRINGVNQTIAANGTDNTRTLVVSSNRAVLPLGAAYHQNGTVSQGTLASTATVTITYN